MNNNGNGDMDNKTVTLSCILSIIITLVISALFGWDNTFLLAVIIIFLMVMFMCIFDSYYRNKREKEEAPQKAIDNQIAYYEKCKQEGITHLETEFDKKKAELIAQSLGCNVLPDLEEYFKNCKKLWAQKNEASRRAELDGIRRKEREQQRFLSKYSECSGRDKRVAMLTDTMLEYRANAESLRKFGTLAVSSSQQKEIDWSIHGGIASGLAGGAAGVSTAFDAQIRNAQIRAQNQANLDRIAPSIVNAYSQALSYSERAERLQEDIDNAKIKMVFETSADKIIENMDFGDVKVTISETGTFGINTLTEVKSPLQEYEGRKLVIDGSICAILYQEGREIGRAMLVLPVYGLSSSGAVQLTGICCANANPSKTYEVKFKPNKLWIMEA